MTNKMIDAIRPFENDLNAMTVEQMQIELEEVSNRIDEDTAWREALTACLNIKGNEK